MTAERNRCGPSTRDRGGRRLVRAVTPRYYFGIYHWRRRGRRLLVALAVAASGAVGWRLGTSRWDRTVAVVAIGLGLARVGSTLRTLLSPPPWALERYKYVALADELTIEDGTRLLDVGCGTGRSLVGFADQLPASAAVVCLDVFDDRVILGNAPALARRNARRAGLEAMPVRGDASRLPIADDSQDVVTACRVLHDLPATAIEPALEEFARVLAPDGVLGVLELPLTPAGIDADPETYWLERIEEADFRLETVQRLPRRKSDEAYLLVTASPA
ncbi:class I SAM-dependent methyltransferase [Natronobeatus ordinarius]|uniref:class I SAM-dependent methyltransferase n=1 Tax=Natronobeatus ordinarius TaxID=2963433 RepID=UPI0020CC3AE1|nr:class I SAM-dependent methyltransferase [Natronobeatus ordinarius]